MTGGGVWPRPNSTEGLAPSIAGIFSRALILVGSGIAAGISVLVFVIWLTDEVAVVDVADGLLMTAGLMLLGDYSRVSNRRHAPCVFSRPMR